VGGHGDDCDDLGCTIKDITAELFYYSCEDEVTGADAKLTSVVPPIFVSTAGPFEIETEIYFDTFEITADNPQVIFGASDSEGEIEFCIKTETVADGDLAVAFSYVQVTVTFDFTDIGFTMDVSDVTTFSPEGTEMDISEFLSVRAVQCSGVLEYDEIDDIVSQNDVLHMCIIPTFEMDDGTLEDTNLAEITRLSMDISYACTPAPCNDYGAIAPDDTLGWVTANFFTEVEEFVDANDIAYIKVSQRMLEMFFSDLTPGDETSLSITGEVFLAFKTDSDDEDMIDDIINDDEDIVMRRRVQLSESFFSTEVQVVLEPQIVEAPKGCLQTLMATATGLFN